MEIKAKYDKLIVVKITNSDGEVIKVNEHHHFTIGKVGDVISGGFYITKGAIIPDELNIIVPNLDMEASDGTK